MTTTDRDFPTIPRPLALRRNGPRAWWRMWQGSAFKQWAWSPIIVLRVSLVVIYLLYIYASVIAFIAGIPLFDKFVSIEGYTSVWAALTAPAAVVAAVSSISDRWEKVEKWAALALTGLQSGYVLGMNSVGFFLGDLARQYVGVIALIAIVLPATRFIYLAAQSGKAPRNG